MNVGEEGEKLFEGEAETGGVPEGGERNAVGCDVVVETLEEEELGVGGSEVQRHRIITYWL